MVVFTEQVPRWLAYSIISSLLCMCGGFCVPLISFIFRNRKNIDAKLVNYGLSLSAGSMITTALYKMLPSSDSEKANQMSVFLGVLMGMCLSLFLKYVIHARASESLIQCAHDSEPLHHHHHEHEQITSDSDQDQGATVVDPMPTDATQTAEFIASQQVVGEQGALLKAKECAKDKCRENLMNTRHTLLDLLSTVDAAQAGDGHLSNACVPVTKGEGLACVPPIVRLRPSITSLSKTNVSEEANDGTVGQQISADLLGVPCLENEVGYDLENLSIYRQNFHSQRHSHRHDHTTSHHTSSNDYGSLNHAEPSGSETAYRSHHHRHHFETPFSKLLSIGMQTCLVITLHKFPEGFIIFYTNQSSDVSKALGFSIFLSLCIHNFVEGFSMTLPFYAAFESKALALLVTAIFGGLSQPLGALIGYLIFRNKKPGKEMPHMDLYLSMTAGFLLVIGLEMFQTGTGFSQGHHHHEGEADEEIKSNHTSVNTCLKWCCVGALLILASGVFK
ncbi:hypothetical protein HG537_0A02050 [Torulaspora globosa]|uniref:Zinc/iron permease n=1 Tax=Torulaspora globosa TaxID=48254 RepID=A0A7H9HJ88_9SACH|nr:hypothetical protein HG537_0A02050 [Torulaspora sp. CBS 2947]